MFSRASSSACSWRLTLNASAIVLMRFAFRIGNHFGFSDGADDDPQGYDANFGALIDERSPFRLIRLPYNALMTHVHRQFSHDWRGFEANVPTEAAEFPSQRRASSPTSAPAIGGAVGRHIIFEPFPELCGGTVRQHVFAPPALFAVCGFRLKRIIAVGSGSASIVTRPIDVTSMRSILTVITTIVASPMSPRQAPIACTAPSAIISERS